MSRNLHLSSAFTESGGGTSPPSPIRVVLADDHPLMCRGMRRLLDSQEDVEVIAQAGDQASAIRTVWERHPRVLVLDLRLPGGSSIETIVQLREQAPGTRIVVMTMAEEPVFAQCALAAGALGFVTKDLADSELPQAVRAAAHGDEYVSPRVAQRLQASRARKLPARSLTALPELREGSAGAL